ncbi:hypothetical protein P8605_08940 [Streptomyces sp. T-3]|nr:hypothetical protein [Streptomyces sp. T-3]
MMWYARGGEPGDVDQEFIDIATRELDDMVRQEFDELINEVWERET